MSWNHRVVKVDDEEGTLIFAEVVYDEDGKPLGFHEPFMCSETMDGLRELLTRLTGALDEPVLDATTMVWTEEDEGNE